ncbi:putative hydrolase of the HAD superfamily [Kitasatospora sp. MAP12-15]|uniref:HAD-IA family hydrolase n=1 Tax=unclassified Kitasatospora TaxID=2633591 RepID=UPI002474A845|nr:HAD-IA family hydrolase [Kitasatospora sp. MAP12-44]MDH6113297.1 putative hydrolase of the HAD superfamily [Kitasatospora sp. MAP12-44]
MAGTSNNGTPPSTYRGLILDFAGVLTTDALAVHREWCVSQGLDAEAWRRTLNTHPVVRRWYADLERGVMSQAEWNRRTAPILGVADHENLMGRAWAGVRPAEGMVELAKAARAAGYAVAMLSNSFGLDPYDPYEACGVWPLFDVTVVSECEGIAKPDPAIYQLVLDRMGLPGEACVFVDDHPANLPPAEALGITTVLADGQPETVDRIAALLGIAVVTV